MIDLSKEYGIVFEGGGAKGAYQIGVWKTLQELGVKINAVAGVSVGALNGALLCMGDIELAEKIWTDISYSRIMEVNDEDMEHILNRDIKNMDLLKITKKGMGIVASGGIDVTPLRNLIEEFVDEDKVKNSEIELYMGTVNLSDFKEIEVCAKELEDGQLVNYLIASASLPGFKREKMEGKSFLDGGMVNNVPIDLLTKRGYKNIIVVRIYGIGLAKRIKVPEDVTLIEIAPRVDLGNILEFKTSTIRRNIKIGYYDALRVLEELSGKIYYIDSKEDELWYLAQFAELSEGVKRQCLEYYKEYDISTEQYVRKMLETICPAIASELGLEKNWSYKELYLSVLEACAKLLRVRKYAIYSTGEFIEEIRNSYKRYPERIAEQQKFTKILIQIVLNDILETSVEEQ